MKVAAKFALVIFLLTVVVLGVSAQVRIARERELFESDARRDHELIGATLALSVGHIWQAGKQQEALALVASANLDRADLHISWVSLDGARSDAMRADRRPVLDLNSVNRTQHQLAESSADGTGHDSEKYLVSTVPVFQGSTKLGYIEVEETLSDRDNYLSNTIRNLITTTGILVLCMGGLVMALGVVLIGRPLSKLAKQASEVGRGRWDDKLHLAQNDEIGWLSAEMKGMYDKIIQARSELVQEHEARIRASEQLRHAERLGTVGKLAAGLAHELGTPLNVISGRAKMIARSKISDAEVPRYANVIDEQAQRMTAIIRQLLDFARRREPHKSAIDLRHVASHTVELLATMAKQRGVELRLDASAPVTVQADAAQVEQVVANLVVNSIQACDAGDHITIAVGAEHDATARSGFITIRDTGAGMDADVMQHAFEPFFTTKKIGEGTGLGLSVAQSIVQEHEGWFRMKSVVGQGTEISLHLPVTR